MQCDLAAELDAGAESTSGDWRALVKCVLADDFGGVLALAERAGDCRGWAARRGCCVTACGVQLVGGNLLHLALASGALSAATALVIACPGLLAGRCAVAPVPGCDRADEAAALARAAFVATVNYYDLSRRQVFITVKV